MEERTISLIGLPRTGKSTYVGALWLLVQDQLNDELWEEDFLGDRSYIEGLAEEVAKGEEITRTEVDSPHGFSVKVGFKDKGSVSLNLPDLSGEAVRELVEGRVWHRVLGEALEQSHGLMLFVHPDRIEPPAPVALLAKMGRDSGQASNAGSARPAFSPDRACTAAKLVDVLENVLELCWRSWPIPIAVVISAWDRAKDSNLHPGEWFQTRLPGVYGLLQGNPEMVRYAVFGVSAQGGRLPQDRPELLKKDVADRVFAENFDGSPTSLHMPLSWTVWS